MYRIIHRTNYRYNAPVARCRNEAHLRPRDTARQHCLSNDLMVEPTPTSWSERTDFFGNPVSSFVVDGPFDELTVTSTSVVSDVSGMDGDAPPPHRCRLGSRRATRCRPTSVHRDAVGAGRLCFEIAPGHPLRQRPGGALCPEPSFVGGGARLVEAIAELTDRIFKDFVYDPGFSTVTTPLEEVLTFRRGVCQDFAHLVVGCVRSMGLAARYVSGYLETAPSRRGERRIGADASHAWPSVFVPGWGWLDLDPTNDKIVGSNYVTTAWGRDYADVSPLKGIVFGGGDSHLLDVARWMSPESSGADRSH